MKRYITGRLLRAIISVFIVTAIAMTMIYTLIPRELIFKNDPVYQKLGNKDDTRKAYEYTTYEKLGYLYFDQQKDMCEAFASDNYDACMKVDSKEIKEILEDYKQKGFTIEQYKSGLYYAYKDIPISSQIFKFFGNLLDFDHPFRVQDESNPNLERKYYIANDHNGLPSIQCSGCKYKYQWYMDASWPFVHQNALKLNFGISYPTFAYQEIGSILSNRQGEEKREMVVFPTGEMQESSLLLHTAKYKATSTLDRLDQNKFTDNYADCDKMYTDPSMIQTSMTFGIISIFLAYLIAIPAGMSMASHKGKWQDKLGTVYINFMIAVPSLAFIFFGWSLGTSVFGLPSKFPVLGAHNFKSYILPVVILSLLSTSGLMLWTRRFMIDQASADYVKFARAKGLNQKEIFRRHVMRNAMIPIAHGLPGSIILTICGAVLTETVFAIPGSGKLLPDAINDHNNSMIVALTMLFTGLSILGVLLGDILMTFLDPRIQLEEKSGGAH